MDKISFVIGVLLGIIIGFVVAGFIMFYGLSEIGNSIQIQSIAVNTSVVFPLNETQLAEAIKQTTES